MSTIVWFQNAIGQPTKQGIGYWEMLVQNDSSATTISLLHEVIATKRL